MTRIGLGVLLPTSTPDPRHPILGDVPASARFAEAIGLDSIWSTDHLVASAPILDSTAVLAAAAAVTSRIEIGYGVLILALRPAAWAAKQISTLQYLSADRLVLGVGTGNPVHGDVGWRAAGLPFEDRGHRTDAALRVLPGLISGRPTDLGDELQVTMAPGSAVPPILVADDGRPALRRAAAYGDGWICIGHAPAEIRSVRTELARLAAGYGRAAPAVTVVGPRLSGDARQAAATLVEYAEAGVERAILAPTGPDWQRDFEFAAQVREYLTRV